MSTQQTEVRVLRKTLQDFLGELSRMAERERGQGRMIAGIGILFILLSGLSWLLGAGSGAMLPLVAAVFCGILSLEPFANSRFAAWGINDLEERLLREDMQFSWAKGKVPQVTIVPLHRPADGPPPRSGEDLE